MTVVELYGIMVLIVAVVLTNLFLLSRIGDRLSRAKTISVVSMIPETMNRLTSKLYDGKHPEIFCSHQKDGVPTVQLMIISLV